MAALDKKLKIVFMGSSDFAVESMRSLLASQEFEIVSVFTQPDRKVGRKREVKFTPVKELALDLGIKVFQPEKSRDIAPLLEGQEIDFIVVVAYGHIIRQKVIDMPKYDILNVHGSTLPKYRGASPIHAALVAGDQRAGVCVMRMVKELDAGPVYKCADLEVLEKDDFVSLHDKLAKLGAEILPQSILQIVDGLQPQDQDDSQASFCAKITQEDAKIDFRELTAWQIWNRYRAYKYWPKIWFEFKGKKFKLIEIELLDACFELKAGVFKQEKDSLLLGTKDGVVVIKKIQPESKSPMLVADFLRGNPDYFL